MSNTDAAAGADTNLPKEIWVLVVSAFIVALGYGIVAPALPQFASSFGVGLTAASAVISVFALMRLLFAPMSGRLVQKLGERPTYMSGLLITAASMGACTVASEYWQLLVFRALGGIGSTMFTVSALGLLIRMSPPQGRGRVSGIYTASFLIGTITGPLFGGVFARFGLRVPFAIYTVALVVAAAVVFVALRNSRLAAPETDSGLQTMTLREGLRAPMFRAALASNLATGWVIFGVRIALVPLFVVTALEGDTAATAVALTVFAVGNALVLLRSGRLSDRMGRKPFVIAGLLICGLSTMTMGLTDDLVIFYVATAISGIGSGIMGPAQQAAVADVVGSGRRGGPLLAAFQMTSDIGGFAGPLVAGSLAEKLSFEAAWAVTGAIMLLPILLWVVVPKGIRPGSADPEPDERTDDVRGTDRERTEHQLPQGPTELGGERRGEPAREQ
ncbi:MFS transporter [Prescottella equi]|uniref:MFS transporter n=1 Tax=Rhodococcus hoagii TaxID=43767 RepID=UPI00301C95E4